MAAYIVPVVFLCPATILIESEENALSKKSRGSNVNSYQIRRPMRRMWPVFILPTFLCFIIGFIWPFLQGIYLSFTDFMVPSDAELTLIPALEAAEKNPELITEAGGKFAYCMQAFFQNYRKAFEDPSFARAFWNTAGFAVVSIILINVVAFAIAYALTQKMRGSNLFRTVFFMPNLIGGVVLGYIWSMIFDAILKQYGTYLTANATYGFWGLVILVAWQQIGYIMIIYIAGLQAVSEDMLEAARIDGANGWQTLFRVTIPNVMPSITICTFLTLTNSFKMFDQNMALTGGAPTITLAGGTQIKTTELLALNIYSTYNIGRRWHGTAQAKAVIFFLLVAILAIAQLTATRQKEVQQ